MENPIQGTVNLSSVYLSFISLLQHLIFIVYSRHEKSFSDMDVKLLVSSSIFNPALLPSKEEFAALAQFYGSEATMSYDGEPYTSHPLLDKDNFIRK